MKRAYGISDGFTLTKLLIILAISALLLAIAIPSYINYTRRSDYNEIVQATAPFKAGVTECYQHTADLAQCNGGSNYIPADITLKTGIIASLTTVAGVITVTPVATRGISATDTYVLTPKIANNNLTWTTSGGGVTAGYAQ